MAIKSILSPSLAGSGSFLSHDVNATIGLPTVKCILFFSSFDFFEVLLVPAGDVQPPAGEPLGHV